MRPHQKRLAEHDADDDHYGRWRQTENAEWCVRSGERQPPGVQIAETCADQDDGGGGEHNTDRVDPDVGTSRTRLESETQEEDDRRRHNQDPKCWTPTDIRAEDAPDDEREHSGGGSCGTQRAYGGFLLAAGVLF